MTIDVANINSRMADAADAHRVLKPMNIAAHRVTSQIVAATARSEILAVGMNDSTLSAYRTNREKLAKRLQSARRNAMAIVKRPSVLTGPTRPRVIATRRNAVENVSGRHRSSNANSIVAIRHTVHALGATSAAPSTNKDNPRYGPS